MLLNAACEKKLGYISAVLSDGTHCSVSPQALDVLIASNRVQKFKRERGWATVGIDPIRLTDHPDGNFCFWGSDRRTGVPRVHK
jgi:hypothetical protein